MKKELIYCTSNTIKNRVLYPFTYKNTGTKNKPIFLVNNRLTYTVSFPYLETIYIIK